MATMKPESRTSLLGVLPSAQSVLSPPTGILLASGMVYGSASISPFVDVSLVNARFVVQAGGNAKVRREKCKLVHAYIAGLFTTDLDSPSWIGVTYNPYKHTSFVRRDNGAAVQGANRVRCLTIDGRAAVFAWGVV